MVCFSLGDVGGGGAAGSTVVMIDWRRCVFGSGAVGCARLLGVRSLLLGTRLAGGTGCWVCLACDGGYGRTLGMGGERGERPDDLT
jgi:hypothetical protein